MYRGLFNIAVFLDLQKAFDTINHDVLLNKLDLYGLETSATNLLKSYLENRKYNMWNPPGLNPWSTFILSLY